MPIARHYSLHSILPNSSLATFVFNLEQKEKGFSYRRERRKKVLVIVAREGRRKKVLVIVAREGRSNKSKDVSN